MAYLILAHDNPAQLAALVARLVPEGSPDVAIIHADRRSALWPQLQRQFAADSARVVLVRDPVAVRWGHWSQLAAIARLVEAAVASGCDYAHLISGADWPVADRASMVAEVGTGRCHIEACAGEQEERMQTRRFDTRWLQVRQDRAPLAYAAIWQLRRLSRWLDAVRRAMGRERARPFGPWHKGWTWWSLPRDALELLAAELPPLLASGRLRGTVCCDEHVIPTIIAARFPDRLAGYRRFIAWPEGESSPRLLNRADLPQIAASGAWFARKVSAGHDAFFYALPFKN